MPLALIVIAIVLLISAIRGTQSDLAALLKKDFTGEGNFLYWILALGSVGALGYITPDQQCISCATPDRVCFGSQ